MGRLQASRRPRDHDRAQESTVHEPEGVRDHDLVHHPHAPPWRCSESQWCTHTEGGTRWEGKGVCGARGERIGA